MMLACGSGASMEVEDAGVWQRLHQRRQGGRLRAATAAVEVSCVWQ
jgi:hypothetical protein